MVAEIVSTGSYLPGEAISNERMEALVGPLPADVLEGIQVTQRHWMVDLETGDHEINNSAMAVEAARDALRNAGLEASAVDLLVLSTASPDYLLPPLVTFVQEALGLERCATTEVRSGCAGFGEALDIARMYVERGQYKTAVVIGSEAISPLIVPLFLGKDPEKIRMRDRMNPYNFGDGAGAVVVRASQDGRGIIGSAMASVGGNKKPAMQIIGAGTPEPGHKQLQAKRPGDLKGDVGESRKDKPHLPTQALAEGVRATRTPAEGN